MLTDLYHDIYEQKSKNWYKYKMKKPITSAITATIILRFANTLVYLYGIYVFKPDTVPTL